MICLIKKNIFIFSFLMCITSCKVSFNTKDHTEMGEERIVKLLAYTEFPKSELFKCIDFCNATDSLYVLVDKNQQNRIVNGTYKLYLRHMYIRLSTMEDFGKYIIINGDTISRIKPGNRMPKYYYCEAMEILSNYRCP